MAFVLFEVNETKRDDHEKYMRVGIATDHGGFSLKEELLSQLRAAGHEVVDFGAHHLSEGDGHAVDEQAGHVGESAADVQVRTGAEDRGGAGTGGEPAIFLRVSA